MQEKLIAGYPHVQLRCEFCHELIWVAKVCINHFRICSTCLNTKLHKDTSGGTQIIRKELSE